MSQILFNVKLGQMGQILLTSEEAKGLKRLNRLRGRRGRERPMGLKRSRYGRGQGRDLYIPVDCSRAENRLREKWKEGKRGKDGKRG